MDHVGVDVDTQPPPQVSRLQPGKRSKQSSFEVAVLKHLSQVKPIDEDVEGDKNFLLSFLPLMKNLPVEKKLSARMAITQAMQQVVSSTNTPQTITPHFQTTFNHAHASNTYSFPQPAYHQSPAPSVQPQIAHSSRFPSHQNAYPFQQNPNEPQTAQRFVNVTSMHSPTLSGSDNSEVYSVINDDLTELTEM